MNENGKPEIDRTKSEVGVQPEVMPKIAGKEKLIDLIISFGEAKVDTGYYSDGSNAQNKAENKADRYWAEIVKIIDSNFTA